MPRAEFFARLGLFVRRNFLDDDTCACLRDEMQGATTEAASVWTKGKGFVVNPDARRTTFHDVSAATAKLVEDRFVGLQNDLARHFNVRLTGRGKPAFLAYHPGDFHRPHADSGEGPAFARKIRERRVSVVLFLNGETAAGEADGYRGGALTFYGLLDEPRLARHGLPLEGETGLLVAFPANVVHGVAPISDGIRYTVVTWFVEAEGPLS